MASTLAKIRKERIDKVKALRKLGINPYPSKAIRTHQNKELIDDYSKLKNKEVTVVGRIMSWREHGALRFANIQDNSGNIQLIIRKDKIEKFDKKRKNIGWKELSLLDIGDYIQAQGLLIKSKTEEISVDVSELKVLTKAIRPLPEKWEGIKDTEVRFRRRYLDMTMDPQVRSRFIRRFKFWSAIRDFLDERDFIEINTPVLESVTGGADAKPFVTHYDALGQDFYLRISQELPLKRLIGGGFEKVYDIGPRFRNEGFSDEHIPEHVALEWYWAYADYKDGMILLEDMFREVMQKVYGKLKFKIKGFDIDLGKEWECIEFKNIIKDKFGINVFKDSTEKMCNILKKNGVDLGKDINKNRVVDNLWKLVRKDIGGPAFLIEHPKYLSPLSKSNDKRPEIVDRGQPIVAGSELGNFWSELNDPIDQYERFKQQQDMREEGDEEAQMMDIDYVEMLEYGMAPCVGFGISERIFWYFENITAKEGVPFPPVREGYDETTKEIYGLDHKTSKQYNSSKSSSKFNELEAIKPGITKLQALKLIREHTKNENLVKHMLASEAAMKEYAKYFIKKGKLHKDNIETWAIAGLVHDITFEKDPKGHMYSGAEKLRKEKVSEYILQAIEAHGDFKPKEDESLLDEVLRVAEESTGLVVAATLVLPSRKLKDLTVKSILKKFQTKRFAAKINRGGIEAGVERLGLSLVEHFGIVLSGMKEISSELGL